MKSLIPFSSWFFRPTLWDEEEELPELTMTEGIDMYEEGDKIFVKAAVPGIPGEKVNVTFEDGVLRIRARAEKREEKKEKRVTYREDRVTSFDYVVPLPRPIEASTLEAAVDEGVVTISAKIAEEARSKKIPVKTVKKK